MPTDSLAIDHIYNVDCAELLRSLPDESVDLVIADPPYFQVKGDFDFGVFGDRQSYLNWSRQWITECKRVLKPNGTLILWGGVGKAGIMMARLAIMIEDEGILTRQNWVTQRNTRGYGTQRNYVSAREEFLFLVKGKDYTFNVPYTTERSTRKDLGANGKPRRNTHKRVTNVWVDVTEASQSSVERCGHPTVKALRLCDRIIQTHSDPGDLVLIPFVGSGSEVISAIRNDRHFVGSELDEEYFEVALERIEKLAAFESICYLHSSTRCGLMMLDSSST